MSKLSPCPQCKIDIEVSKSTAKEAKLRRDNGQFGGVSIRCGQCNCDLKVCASAGGFIDILRSAK